MRGGFAYCKCGYYHVPDGRHGELEEIDTHARNLTNEPAVIYGLKHHLSLILFGILIGLTISELMK